MTDNAVTFLKFVGLILLECALIGLGTLLSANWDHPLVTSMKTATDSCFALGTDRTEFIKFSVVCMCMLFVLVQFFTMVVLIAVMFGGVVSMIALPVTLMCGCGNLIYEVVLCVSKWNCKLPSFQRVSSASRPQFTGVPTQSTEDAIELI